METALITGFCIVFSAVMVSLAHPLLVKIAVMKSIVDNPNVRRLNKKPVPVLGGVGVFFGIFMTGAMLCFRYDCSELFVLTLAMIIMLFTGVADDIINMSARWKFLMQIVAVALLMANGYVIDDMHGLLGIYTLPPYAAYPLTLITGIGIINAINLIDGVDGLSSGFGIAAATICGVFFTIYGDMLFAMVAWPIAGALIPFFVHNVFGQKYKMFIGDGGSLVLGVVFFAFVVRMLHTPGTGALYPYTVSLTLAVFSVPVFDTLRVMTSRILHGRSPFSPDKNHLHHMFIRMGFSHAMTALTVICLNLFVVLAWVLTTVVFPVHPTWQTAMILVAGLTVTLGVWYCVKYIEKRHPGAYGRMQVQIRSHRVKREGVFLKIQKLLG